MGGNLSVQRAGGLPQNFENRIREFEDVLSRIQSLMQGGQQQQQQAGINLQDGLNADELKKLGVSPQDLPAFLQAFDRSGNGIIDPDEIGEIFRKQLAQNGGPQPEQGGGSGGGGSEGAGKAGDGGKGNGGGKANGAGGSEGAQGGQGAGQGSGSEGADELLQLLLKLADTNGDGQIQPEEMAALKQKLQEAAGDDGKLNKQELSQVLQSLAQDAKANGGPNISEEQIASALEQAGDLLGSGGAGGAGGAQGLTPDQIIASLDASTHADA